MSYRLSEDDARERITALCDDDQSIHSITRTSSPNDGRAFYAVIRSWPHPEVEGCEILCFQNVQLCPDWADLSDNWMKGSYRQRIMKGDGGGARQFAQDFAATAARLDAGAYDRPADYTDLEQ